MRRLRYGTLAVLLAWGSAPSPLAAQLPEPPTPIRIDGKFDTSTEHVLIPVDIGGHRFWCNPDSSYSALISLDRAKALAAGLPIGPGVPTPDGNPPTPGDNSTVADVVVGGVTLPGRTVIVRRFPEEAPDMDCIMGVAVLRRFVVEFDHLAPRITLYNRSTYLPAPDAEQVPLLFRPNPNVPYVDIRMTLGGAEETFRVIPDTGTAYYGAVLVGNAVERVRSLGAGTVPAIVFPDPNIPDRVTQLEAARPDTISIGSLVVNRPVVAMLQGSLGANGSLADGTLGSGFLRRFAVAFDFDGRALYLTPNARLTQPYAFDAIGVGILRRDGRDTVFTVLPDSPGAAAGVQVGDVLLEVDDRPVGAMTPVGLRDLLRVDGATRTVVVDRDGARATLQVRLKARI